MIWQKILEIFWRIYLNIIFWILLWILTSLVIWNSSITVSTTLKYCYKKALNKKLKLMRGAIKYFLKKLLGHEIFRSMASWATNFLKIICKTIHLPSPHPPSPSSYILNVRFLPLTFFRVKILCFLFRLCINVSLVCE